MVGVGVIDTEGVLWNLGEPDWLPLFVPYARHDLRSGTVRMMPIICGSSGGCTVPTQDRVAATRRQGCVAGVRLDAKVGGVVPVPALAGTELGPGLFAVSHGRVLSKGDRRQLVCKWICGGTGAEPPPEICAANPLPIGDRQRPLRHRVWR